MNKMKIILTAFLVLLASPMLVNAETNITDCAELNVTDEIYYLTQDITNSASSRCMNVTANNVTLDCQGYTIDGVDTGDSFAIVPESTTFTTVKNCVLTDWTRGISFHLGANHYANLTNLTISSCTDDAMSIESSNYGSLTDSLISGNDGNGVAIQDSYNWTVRDNTISDNGGYGIRLEIDSADNLIYNNLFNNTNSVDVADSGANDWNTTRQSGTRIYSSGTDIGGNFYTNSASDAYSDTCTDSDFDGFCDDALNLTTGNWDYLPLSNLYEANLLTDCGDLDQAGTTYYLTQNTTETIETCFDIQADNITLDCQGYTIYGNTSENSRGVTGADLVNITVKNCDINGFQDGIYFDRTITSLFYNNTVYNASRTGLRCQGCLDWRVEENTVHDLSYGTWTCCEGVNNSVITNNHFYDNTFGVGLGQDNWNITITNNLLERNTYGILGSGGESGGYEGIFDSLIENNIVLESARGIYLISVNGTTVRNNTVSSNVEDDRAMTVQNSFGNLIYNNLFNASTSVGVYCDYGVCANDWNTTRQNGTRIYSNGFEIGGNYYDSNVTGYSESCTDANYDGFCDTPYTVTGYNITNNVDYLTYSDEYTATPPTTTTTLGQIEETLTDIGTGVGGLLDQMGIPVAVFVILMGLVGGIAIVFKGVFVKFSD